MEVYFVFMNFDPVYERLQGNRSKKGKEVLDAYLNSKHDKLLAELLQPNTYRKRSSLAIVDGFAVEITREQAAILRSAKEVRLVEKNQEFA
ncbi:subtilisin-like protease SBT2.5 isoform X2 [Typha angustifolia]|uniref:subtilisin-like protease SBT2.5 isoform X2 n=1 Tax=Typha angustifolia TaxID=59011 RepID=UPI003C2EF2AE